MYSLRESENQTINPYDHNYNMGTSMHLKVVLLVKKVSFSGLPVQFNPDLTF